MASAYALAGVAAAAVIETVSDRDSLPSASVAKIRYL